MINIRSIRSLENGGGFTLKNGKKIRFRSGWQVADYGVETTCVREAINAVKAMKGNCGVWFENGIYYIDHSFRVSVKREALRIGREYNQISIYGWKTGKLAYCEG